MLSTNATVGVRLAGTGSALPVRVMSNADFAPALATSDEWIRTRTGIRERRICTVEETSASLGLEASRHALEAANLSPDELDLIICATITPDMTVPSTACLIHGSLGCRPIPAFDLNAACSGFIYALSVGEQFIRTGSARNALVIGSDTMSRIVDFNDRSTCVLFGDGAGAVILSAGKSAAESGQWFRLYADGSRSGLIQLNGVSQRAPAAGLAACLPTHPLDCVRMNGREVFKFAVNAIIQLVQEALTETGLTPADISLVIPHQVNQRIIDAAFAHLTFPAEKVMVNLERYGNTSAASVPIALDEAVRTGRAAPGDTVLLLAFGAGLSWSSALLRL